MKDRRKDIERKMDVVSSRYPTGRVFVAGAAVVLALGMLAACAATGAAPDEASTGDETVKPASQEQLIQQNLAKRPDVGTPEYDERVTDRFRIPYVLGQDPAEVVRRAQVSVRDYLEMGYEDAPQTEAEVTQWQVDTNKSLAELTTELNLPYFDPGFRKGMFGPEADGDFANRIVTNFAPYRVQSVALVLEEAIEPGAEPISFDPGIRSASADRITGFSAAAYGGKAGTQELYYDLIASDDNGNGLLDDGDSWYWAGTGQ